jgi:hypothetical protein
MPVVMETISNVSFMTYFLKKEWSWIGMCVYITVYFCYVDVRQFLLL